MQAAVSVAKRYGLSIVANATGTSSATGEDIMIRLVNKTGGAQWKNGIVFNDAGAGTLFPIISTGALITAEGANTVATGIDISPLTITGNAFASPGFTVTGAGTITAGLWNGTAIPLAYGGANAALTASAGGLVYSTSTTLAVQAAGTSGYFARSGGTGVPTWFNLFGTANTWTALQSITGSSARLTVDGTVQADLRLLSTAGSGKDWRFTSVSDGTFTMQENAAGNIFTLTAASTTGSFQTLAHVLTITGTVTDGYSSALKLAPGYTAATAQTVTRHNYLDLANVTVAGVGPAAVTDAAVFRFNAATGTHSALAANGSVATAITSLGPTGAQTTIQGWMKINVNGTLRYIPYW